MNFINRVLFPAVTIAIALGTAFFGTWDFDDGPRRAIMFTIIAMVFASELVSMLIRTGRGQWDQLAIWMALTRAGVMNYFALLAINFFGRADFPDPLFSASRVFMGTAGIIAFLILSREDVRGYQALSLKRKIAAGGLFFAALTFYATIALIW